ncbi:MAG: hypothetical protein KF784_10455 [Fimbriimonadaceae bacterium]|nr:hypothetical protein [Fimbriimonadaceae bacterium]
MRYFARYLASLSFVLIATQALPQGSAAGYGQGGGFGGGGAGAAIGRDDAEKTSSSPDNDARVPHLWTSRSAVLTPGDRVEFTYKVKKGETLMAGATSDAFDPVLVIEDEKGTKLKEVDDRVEGDQSPFIIYRFTEAGTYKLKVVCYKPVAGGKFTLKTRTFMPLDAPFGQKKHDSIPPEVSDTNRIWVSMAAKKNGLYDLRRVYSEGNYTSQASFVRVVGPTGVEASDFQQIRTPDGSVAFKALADGAYFVEYGVYETKRLTTEFHEVVPIRIKPADKTDFELQEDELAVVEFPVTESQIVRTTIVGGKFRQAFTAPKGKQEEISTADDSYGVDSDLLWFLVKVSNPNDVVRVFQAEGTAQLVLRSMSTKSSKITISNTESLPTWEDGKAIKDTLEIGESKLFLIESNKSELMRVFAKAAHFLTKIDIFSLTGKLENSIVNRETLVSADDLYFPEAKTFIIRFSCEGNGGSGDFELRRDEVTATKYTLDRPETFTFEGGKFGLYAVDLVAGKRYEFIVDQPGTQLRVDLLDDDGQFLRAQWLQFDKVQVHYFVPTKSGRHRLWLRASTGTRQFKLQLHTPPGIGGG